MPRQVGVTSAMWEKKGAMTILHPLAKLNAAAFVCLLLAGCGDSSNEGAQLGGAGMADCAIGPGSSWRRDCGVDRDGELLTLRHKDGGFRRFRIVDDGRGVVTADGSEQAKVNISGQGMIEVAVGEDRYRLPASIANRP